MSASVFELFKLGVGPSSSHTMGPMTAASRFVALAARQGALADAVRIEVKLYASLALTGRGHHTDRAVMLGLMGFDPARLDPDEGDAALASLAQSGLLPLPGGPLLAFNPGVDIVFAGRERLSAHPNALRFTFLRRKAPSFRAGI